MSIYSEYVFPDKLISPINGYSCKRITVQTIKNFGFNTKEELLQAFPGFPLMAQLAADQTRSAINKGRSSFMKNSLSRTKSLNDKYDGSPVFCKNCHEKLPFEVRGNTFCSRSCGVSHSNKQMSNKSKSKRKTSLLKTIEEKRKNSPGKQLCFKENTCVQCHRNFFSLGTAKTCSKACYVLHLSKNARANPNCGGRRNHKKFFLKTNIKGEIFNLESSYESKLADILNSLNVFWIKPINFLPWTDDTGNKRRYHPDFYLPAFNLYMDPKNDYLISLGLEKINRAESENGVLIKVVSKKNLNEIYISELLKC